MFGYRFLIIDNLDSYTYNLVRLCNSVTGIEPLVLLHSEPFEHIQAIIQQRICTHIVISPGPGNPINYSDVKVCKEIVENPPCPVLGVCLGLQILAVDAGMSVVRTREIPKHGVSAKILHFGKGLFNSVPNLFSAVRYNSLVAAGDSDLVEISALDQESGEIMGMSHKFKPIHAVQFHPESICSEFGEVLFKNFLEMYPEEKLKVNAKPSPLTICMAEKNIDVFVEELDVFVDPLNYCNAMISRNANCDYFCWLDSAVVSENSRFSYVADFGGELFHTLEYSLKSRKLTSYCGKGFREYDLLYKITFFDELKSKIQDNICADRSDSFPFEFIGGYCGYFGYEMKEETNLYNDLNRNETKTKSYPDSFYMFCDRILIFDNLLKKVWISVLYKSQEQRESQLYWLQEKKAFLKNFKDIRENQSFYSDNQDVYNILKTTENEYVQKVLECQRHILSGDSYELCLTNSILASTSKSSFSVHDAFKKYCKLRKSNPAPYSCFIYCARLELGIICSSPERFLKIDKDGWAECKPIKGTLKRNLSDEKLDIKLVEQLRSSAKDRAENLMIADLILNDLTRTCDLDSVHASKLMEIETFATVHHMVSTIRGKLSSGQDPIDCIRTCFPPGSMTGAPKKRSMDILHEIEKNPRGIYSGCIGYFSVNRAAEFNVVIRTIVSTLRNANEGVFVHEMEIGCGGAIISLSDPLAEYEEMKLKSEAVLKII